MSVRQSLLARYKEVYASECHPEGTSDVVPSIPFVDPDLWEPGKGLLVYGSAESTYEVIPSWMRTEAGWNRHWHCFERWLAKDPDFRPQAHFPYVHLEPVNRGALLVAGAFLSTLMGRSVHASPESFVRTLAIANFGKFPMVKDYADKLKLLEFSTSYVRADLEILRPAVVLLVHTTCRTLRDAGNRTLDGPWRTVPVMQCQPFNLDWCAQQYPSQAAALEARYLNEPWAQWIPRVHGRLRPHMWPYLSEVDEGWRLGWARP